MAPNYSSVTKREVLSRVILCLISVKIAQKLKDAKFAVLAVFVANFIGKTNFFNTLIRTLLPTYDSRIVDKVKFIFFNLIFFRWQII